MNNTTLFLKKKILKKIKNKKPKIWFYKLSKIKSKALLHEKHLTSLELHSCIPPANEVKSSSARVGPPHSLANTVLLILHGTQISPSRLQSWRTSSLPPSGGSRDSSSLTSITVVWPGSMFSSSSFAFESTENVVK